MHQRVILAAAVFVALVADGSTERRKELERLRDEISASISAAGTAPGRVCCCAESDGAATAREAQPKTDASDCDDYSQDHSESRPLSALEAKSQVG